MGAAGHARGEYQQLYSGRKFFALDPRPEDVTLEDIAHSLSQVNRFGGHSIRPYSVAHHSINVSRVAGKLARKLVDAAARIGVWSGDPSEYVRQVSLAGLLHDSAESLVGDLVTPVKKQMPQYREVEHRILNVIFKKFGVPYAAENLPTEVRRADTISLATERLYLVNVLTESWGLSEEPEEMTTEESGRTPYHPSRSYSCKETEGAFIAKFHELTKGAYL